MLLDGIFWAVLFFKEVELHGIERETIVDRLHHESETVVWTEFLQ
jgi:hypothetical protein